MADLSFLEKEKLHTGFGNEITAKTYDEVLKQAGLNWKVDVHPTYTMVDGKLIQIPGTNTVVRNEDQKALGIVSEKYKLVNNADAFAFTESLFNSKEIEFIRGGSYRGGSATWLEARVVGKYSILGDDVECYLIFMNTHDGTGSVRCMIVPNRIACSNALNLPLKNHARSWRCVHSGDPMRKIDEARQILLAGSSYMNALQKEAEMLYSIKLTDTQVKQFVDRIFPLKPDMTDKCKDNQMIRRNQLLEVYYGKDDLLDFDNTGYRFISAVADYVDHAKGKNTKNAAINRYMGVVHGNPLVDKAYDMVLFA